MARRSPIFQPTAARDWHQFVIGSIITGTLLGIGVAIGNFLVTKYLKEFHIKANYGVIRRW